MAIKIYWNYNSAYIVDCYVGPSIYDLNIYASLEFNIDN